ncbi:hypothetical protein [Bacillus sp. ISL-4]|uniref:hypothetical protein n=1 Tax=Bacillus sp. ISL-4 TaxID=2819125 RepID=UPI001BE9E43A|nr:hypothetical protein [Bacillus sp. ISL-4]
MECILSSKLKRGWSELGTDTCIPASKQGCIFFEWSFGWGFWSANNLQEEGFAFIGEHFHFNRKWISGGWIVKLLSSWF